MNLGSSSSTTPEKDDENEAAGQNQILDEFTIFVTVILTNADPEADVAIMDKASNFTIKDSKAVIILIKLLFTAEMLEANQIKHHAALLRSFFKNEKGSEGFVGRARNAFYDEELLEEDVCLAWGEKASKKTAEETDDE
ncbi:hypothetical protein HK100_004932 [Physocladia obscura]|uniref:W2 domain-containing protein n=1 Tax=Physocladia obscura TaxID=109957 RepID=A0AAD5SUT4_9FUNG|nr:hypothetical protein HK100_004932 [Physocladia obscura]